MNLICHFSRRKGRLKKVPTSLLWEAYCSRLPGRLSGRLPAAGAMGRLPMKKVVPRLMLSATQNGRCRFKKSCDAGHAMVCSLTLPFLEALQGEFETMMKLLALLFPAGVFFIIRRNHFGVAALVLQSSLLLWPLATILALAGLAQHNSELSQAYNFTYRQM